MKIEHILSQCSAHANKTTTFCFCANNNNINKGDKNSSNYYAETSSKHFLSLSSYSISVENIGLVISLFIFLTS
jgi:hypothetical protein